jgi:hypothetical protein
MVKRGKTAANIAVFLEKRNGCGAGFTSLMERSSGIN